MSAALSEAPLQLLHPIWCADIDNDSAPHNHDDPHRGRPTCWESAGRRFTLNRARWDERYVNDQRKPVNEYGDPAPTRDSQDCVELTVRDLEGRNEDGSDIAISVDLNARDLRLLITMAQQQLEDLEDPHGLKADFTRDLKWGTDD